MLIRLVHRGLTLNDIFSKLNNVQFFSIMDVGSGYQNLMLDERSSYSQYSHANLVGTDTRDCCLEKHLLGTYVNEKLTRYSKIYQVCLA